MSLTNAEQCLGAGNGTFSRKGSRDTQCGDRNGNRGNSRFANSSSTREVKDNRISQLLITKDGPRSIQFMKILEAIPLLYQDHHYDYISDIIITNIEPTQEKFLSDILIKRQPKQHVKPGIVNPIIGLDVPSGNDLVEMMNSGTFELVPFKPRSKRGNRKNNKKKEEKDKETVRAIVEPISNIPATDALDPAEDEVPDIVLICTYVR